MSKKMNVAELFAGVGGFRVGLERSSGSFFNIVYSNQWEPNTKIQHAFDCYIHNFGESDLSQFHDNTDISIVNNLLDKNKEYIKESIDLVVGGFPCQDYSVATTKAKGMKGKKGILWWEIERFLKHTNPNYLLLENVDRLLISPSDQKGRDFMIMLSVLYKNGYNVEWRIINSAEYGSAQRRKRVFIFAQKINSNIDNNISFSVGSNYSVLTKNLKIKKEFISMSIDISSMSTQNISDNKSLIFLNYGFMKKGKIYTVKVFPDYKGKQKTLISILEKNIGKEFFLNDVQKEKIFKLKDGGKRERKTKDEYIYNYSEGKMSRYDNIIGKPSRTMLTSEGSINRSTHIIKSNSKYRFITPKEAERLNGFKDNWTSSISSKNKRYFMMGNALVTGIIEEIGNSIKYFENK